jgi:hypothetical protein
MIFAALPKLSGPARFAEVIGAYGILPDSLLLPMAIMLPMLELLAAFLLLRGAASGLWLAAILMLLFVGVLLYGIWLGLDIDCGCFGPDDIESSAFHGLRTALIRDLFFLIPIVYCFLHHYIIHPKLSGEKQ